MYRIENALFTVLLGTCVLAGPMQSELENARHLYDQFKRTYGKNYAVADDAVRFGIFKQNLKRVEQYQKEELGTAEYGITRFADMTAEEFAKGFTNAKFAEMDQMRDIGATANLENAPTSFDWREHRAVRPVEDQGECGSCWAFSVAGNIEGQWYIKKGEELILSKQQLVDCDTVDEGCEGGYPPSTYKEVIRMGGLELQSDYPYYARQKTCSMEAKKIRAHISTSIILPTNEESQAAWLAQNGPMASALNADRLQFYTRGVVHASRSNCPSSGLNHAVLTVGYGVEGAEPYWIVKNSWGTSWGEQGYFRILRGKGTCGINELVSSATII